MNRFETMIEDLATELIEYGYWEYQPKENGGYYHFRHPSHYLKVSFTVSGRCSTVTRIKKLLKCELRHRYNEIGYRPGIDSYGVRIERFYHDPYYFHPVVRKYLEKKYKTST